MDPITITLVIALHINGQDVDHSEVMTSLTACWQQARIAMAEAVTIKNDGPEDRIVRIGCFAAIKPTPKS